MKKPYLFLALIILALAQPLVPATTAANAQILLNPVEDNLLRLRVLPERGKIRAGEEIWIGLEQSIKSGWHTYWKNPGDSGTAPDINWTLPKGFSISELHYPTPDKIPYPPLLNYGYSDKVMLLQKLQAPKDLPEGPLTLIADIEVLVCEEECIPIFDTIEITLNSEGAETEDNTAYIATSRAKLPQQTNWSVTFIKNADNLVLKAKLPTDHGLANNTIRTANFIPEDWGILHNAAPRQSHWDDKAGILTLTQKMGERSAQQLGEIKGVISFDTRDFLLGFNVTAHPEGSKQAALALKASKSKYSKPPKTAQNSYTSNDTSGNTSDNKANNKPSSLLSIPAILGAALAALLGGMILNLMPCVFPVLSIKALSLVKIAAEKPEHAKAHGLSYAAGVIGSFLTIAAILIALQTTGSAVGWGFQLQSPTVIALLAYLFLIIGLNLSGAFEISNHFGNLGNRLTEGDGLTSSFFTGVLATIVATPCTAPFMGVAIGIALTQPAAISLLIFACLGAGLALPYVALSFIPALQKRLPKPGKWMESFRQLLAFPMFASAAWLIWVLSQQVGDLSVLMTLLGMVSIAFALWLIQHSDKRRILAIAAIILALAFVPTTSQNPSQNEHIIEFGSPFSEAALGNALEGNSPVFVEMTAAWCITCKVNHSVAINIDKTRKLFAQKNVNYLIGDWTNRDENITKYLKSFGRSGVPLYVFYGAPDPQTNKRPEPVILPQILTPDIVTKTIMGTNKGQD